MVSSARPSLTKKRSGTFWRRKSSLGMQFGRDSEDMGSTAASPGGLNGDTVMEEEGDNRSTTPAPGSDMPTISKRKSGTFWKRRSSLSLATAFRAASGTGAGDQNENKRMSALNGLNSEQTGSPSNVPRTNGVNGINGHDAVRDEEPTTNGHRSSENDRRLPSLNLTSTRSYSPPPQLPAFVGGGGGLGGEDIFKDIH